MKNVAKKLIAVVLMGVMMFSLTACGVDMDKVKGDWTLSTVGGKSLEETAAAMGQQSLFLSENVNITDKNITTDFIQADGTHYGDTFDLKQRANGVEGYKGDTLAMSLAFDEKANTLTMKVGADEASAVAYVFVKGKKDLDAEYQALVGGAAEETVDYGEYEEE